MKKMMKKLLLACVTAAVLISCFCVAAFAEVGNGKISDILEYYDAEKTFAYDTFTDAEGSGRLTLSQAEAAYRDGLAVIEMNRRSTVAYSATCKDGNVGVNFRFRIDGTDAGNLQFELAGDTPRLLFTFDFAGTKTLTYTLTDKNGKKGDAVAVENLTLTEGTFYTVSVYYVKETKTATLSVTDNTTGTVYGGEIATPDLTAVAETTLRLPNKNNAGATLSLDYVEVYTGTFARTFEEKQKKSEEAVINLVNLYNTDTTTDAQKEELIETLHTLLSAGFTATEGSAAYEALYGGESLGDKIPYQTFAVTFYTKKMIDAVEKIDTNASYTDRSTFVDELNRIHDVILAAGVEDSDDGSEYALALAKYHTESAAVEKIRTDAELLISTMTGVLPTKLKYAELSALLEAVADTEQDATYPGIADAIAVYDQIEALVSDANQKALTFLTAVTELADTDASFAARYSGYTAAGASYYDDETFFFVKDGETVHPITDALTAYAAWSEYFDNIVSYNESFLSYISRAVYATERSSRIGCLMSAESLMKDEDGNLLVEIEYIRAGVLPADVDFTNSVECAIAKIDEMNRALEADKTAIANYIAAVNRLKSATTIQDRKALLAEVKALRVADDLLTVDGVVEANIAFSAIEAEVTLWEGNSKIVVDSAAALKKTNDLSERAALIMKARAALAALDDKTYEGVAEAETAIKQAVKDYNIDIALMNEMFTRETDAALDVSYAAAPKTIVGVIAWITKEHY